MGSDIWPLYCRLGVITFHGAEGIATVVYRLDFRLSGSWTRGATAGLEEILGLMIVRCSRDWKQ